MRISPESKIASSNDDILIFVSVVSMIQALTG
jgi:hypothetical protein